QRTLATRHVAVRQAAVRALQILETRHPLFHLVARKASPEQRFHGRSPSHPLTKNSALARRESSQGSESIHVIRSDQSRCARSRFDGSNESCDRTFMPSRAGEPVGGDDRIHGIQAKFYFLIDRVSVSL